MAEAPANKMELKWALSEDRRTLTLEMWMNGAPLGHMLCDATAVEDIANKLAEARANMLEEVPRELDIGARVAGAGDPIWRIPGGLQQDGKPLFLRDPGFGWRGYLFPEKEARAVAKWLLEGLPPATDGMTDDERKNLGL